MYSSKLLQIGWGGGMIDEPHTDRKPDRVGEITNYSTETSACVLDHEMRPWGSCTAVLGRWIHTTHRLWVVGIWSPQQSCRWYWDINLPYLILEQSSVELRRDIKEKIEQ